MTPVEDQSQIVPLVLTGTAILVTAVIYRIYFAKKKWQRGRECQSKMSVGDKILLVDPQKKYTVPLVEREELSHDTRRFRFGLPSKDHRLGLPTGQHLHLSAKINDDLIIRSYTPVSSDDEHGYFDLVIKVYLKNVHPKFPEGGMMSQHLNSLKMGETIDVRGPSGRLIYLGKGAFSIKKMRKDAPVTVHVQRVAMIAGGTGITPMLQLIRQITRDPSDETEASLIFANQTEKDILLRDELENYARKFPSKFNLWYTVDTAPANWQYSVGFINDGMIEQHLPPPSPSTLVVMCGPPPMINHACIPNLEKLNYDKDTCFTY